MKTMKTAIILSLALASSLPIARAAEDRAFPVAPVKMVVPYPPGGTVDIVARLLAQAMAGRLGQPVTVDNKAGAGTLIGADFVAKSKPDGYTLLVAPNTTLTVAPNIYKKIPFRMEQLDPIGFIASNQFVITVNAKSPYASLQDLLDASRKDPERISYGSFGTGTITHLAGELMNQTAAVHMLHVPYKGAAPALTDLLGNNISMMFDAVPAAAIQVKSGSIRALAVTGKERSALLPNVLTVAEAGLPNYRVDGWIALVAPTGTPKHVRETLSKTLDAVSVDPVFQRQLRDSGLDPAVDRKVNVNAFIAEESQRFHRVAERAKLSLD
ncbi:Bug family tripartite tricarboxylate transporter substrate binding protein [Ottowia thiooxydans]|uniref:Tripartite-type tricarboxylate transporter receptor subunit TctC n=1 Tax=Ottowia thiooxydans TaxID=219182 RepID=A0ABV2QCW6_9BURK